jgi:hypothetical protein
VSRQFFGSALPSILALAASLVAVPSRADLIPISTNALVPEFGGQAAFAGDRYIVGFVAGTNILSQQVSRDGQVMGAPSFLGANPGFPPSLAVACGSSNGLVAWSDDSVASGPNLCGRLVASNGTPAGAVFQLSTVDRGVVRAAASDGAGFLVVWQDETGTLYGQLVTAAGACSGSAFACGIGRNVAATFGADYYLVAWQADDGAGGVSTYCARISRSGVVGAPVRLDTAASLDANPLAAAFNGTDFLVVWNRSSVRTDTGRPVWNLCGRRVSSNGAALGDMRTLVGEQASFPALAFDGDNYLLAWAFNADTTNADIAVHARFLNRDASPIGPIFTPLSRQAGQPALLPFLLYGGTRFLLTATYGTFVLHDNGDVIGFQGGDVFGTLLPHSMTSPVLSGMSVADGRFRVDLQLVPGQTYTIEDSTNLLSWTAIGLASSICTNVVALEDDRGMAGPCRFYRAVVGNTVGPSFSFLFLEYANAGSFGSGYVPTVTYPVSLDHYAAGFLVENEVDPPVATNVFFTGAAGSGLSAAAADSDNSRLGDMRAFYQSPDVSSPAAAPGGTWTVLYKGSNVTFTAAEPQANSRLVVLLPSVTVAGGVLTGVNWVYRDATTGATLAGAPSDLVTIQVQVEGVTGVRIYDSPQLDREVTGHVFTSGVDWSSVVAVNMTYNDTLGNHYVVQFTKP